MLMATIGSKRTFYNWKAKYRQPPVLIIFLPFVENTREFSIARLRYRSGWEGALAMSLMLTQTLGGTMSGSGPSRHFAASRQFGRFRSEADISERFAERIYEYAP